MKMRHCLTVLSVVLCCVIFCSFAFPSGIRDELVINAETNHVYRYAPVEKILSGARNIYDGQYVLVTGRFKNGSDKTFNITDSENDDSENDFLECVVKKDVTVNVSGYKHDDFIAVYGKCEFHNKGIRRKDVVKVTAPPSAVKTLSDEAYFTEDGEVFDKASAVMRSLADEKIKYSISPQLAAVEVNIRESENGVIEGYQYVLDSLDENDNAAESLFVCYFDKTMLEHPTDISKKAKETERAIVSNISGDPGNSYPNLFNSYSSADNGKKFRYYRNLYRRPDGTGYYAEYAFTPYNDGMVMFLYVYIEPKHRSDVMFVMRFLE